MERAVILCPAQMIEPQALPERIAGHDAPEPRLGGDWTVEEIEREHILAGPRANKDPGGSRQHPGHRRLDAVAKAPEI